MLKIERIKVKEIPKVCILEEDKMCDNCCDCFVCDIDPTKNCDNCAQCLEQDDLNATCTEKIVLSSANKSLSLR